MNPIPNKKLPADSQAFEDFDYIRSGGKEYPNFQLSLFGWWRKEHGFGCKSIIDHDIDFFSDLVNRHDMPDRLAIEWLKSGARQTLSYSELRASILLQEGQWPSTLQPGQTVAIVSADPVLRIVTLMAALRRGLVATVIPATGPSRLAYNLTAVDCQHLLVDPGYWSWVPAEWKTRLVLPTAAGKPTGHASFCYPKDAIALRTLDPWIENGGIHALRASELFTTLIRDGYRILGMTRGARLAWCPDSGDEGPFLELATLLCGGTITLLDEHHAEASWRLLFEAEHHAVRISRRLIECYVQLATAGGKPPNWRRWFRHPVESIDPSPWLQFTQQCSLETIPQAQLAWSATSGGICLGSVWSPDIGNWRLYPPSGLVWQLGQVGEPGRRTLSDFGRLCLFETSEAEPVPLPTPFMLSKSGDAFRFVGCYPAGRQGRPYPREVVSQALRRAGAWHAIIEIPNVNGLETPSYTLLGFMEDRTASELVSLLEREVGTDAIPDDIVMIPLVPRLLEDGSIDEAWIQTAYLNGEYDHRIRHPVHQAISRFKLALLGCPDQAIYQQPEPPK